MSSLPEEIRIDDLAVPTLSPLQQAARDGAEQSLGCSVHARASEAAAPRRRRPSR